MKITCVNCAANHELEPPAWVLQSGRPFRFRCSNCGVSQMVSAPSRPAPLEAPRPAAASHAVAATEVPSPEGSNQLVYLKQDGKVYLVRDWATVQRWIMERRVERGDLVSEGGVRWEPIGTRPELGSFFVAIEQLEAAETGATQRNNGPFPWEVGTPAPSATYPFPGPSPDENDYARSRFGRLDDETEGVPTGLPVLPTEEVGDDASGGSSDPESPPPTRRATSEPMSLSNAPTVLREPDTPPTVPTRSPDRFDPFSGSHPNDPDIAPPGLVTPMPVSRQSQRTVDTPINPSRSAAPPPPIQMFGLDSGGRTPAPAGVREGVGDSGAIEFGQDLFEGTSPPSPDEDPVRLGTPIWMWAGAAAITLLVTAVLLVVAIGFYANNNPVKAPEDQPALGQAISAPPDAPRPVESPVAVVPADTDAPKPELPVEAPKPEVPVEAPKPDVPPPDAPKPEAPKPEVPKPEAPKPPSTKKLVDKAWKSVESNDFDGAAATFEKALAQSPSDKDALYGYGYVQLQRGDKDGAKAALCKALAKAGSDESVRRDVSGLLSQAALSCD